MYCISLEHIILYGKIVRLPYLMFVLQARKKAYDSLDEARLLTSVKAEETPEDKTKEEKESEENTETGKPGNGQEKKNKTVEVRENKVFFLTAYLHFVICVNNLITCLGSLNCLGSVCCAMLIISEKEIELPLFQPSFVFRSAFTGITFF